jgi:deazaflavin-dependent oxidoreductase (nitroreductase family)
MARPLAGRRYFPLWAIVQHRGRRSGRSYSVPVAIRASPDTFTIPLPWGSETQWLRNVLAAGTCTIRWAGADHRASDPRVVDVAEALDAFHPSQRLILRAGGIRSVMRLRRDVSAS